MSKVTTFAAAIAKLTRKYEREVKLVLARVEKESRREERRAESFGSDSDQGCEAMEQADYLDDFGTEVEEAIENGRIPNVKSYL